jgi:hypothetical protein
VRLSAIDAGSPRAEVARLQGLLRIEPAGLEPASWVQSGSRGRSERSSRPRPSRQLLDGADQAPLRRPHWWRTGILLVAARRNRDYLSRASRSSGSTIAVCAPAGSTLLLCMEKGQRASVATLLLVVPGRRVHQSLRDAAFMGRSRSRKLPARDRHFESGGRRLYIFSPGNLLACSIQETSWSSSRSSSS